MTENRSNYTKSYFCFQMGRLKVCTIFSVIFAALGFPLLNIIFAIEESDFDFDTTLLIPLLLLGIVCVMGTCAMSYITPILTYRHLYTKTNADNILSLPLTANQRFLSDTLAAYTSFALPYLISCALSVLVGLIAGPESDTLTIAEYAFKGFFLLITFSALNIAVITCCGRIVEAILYPIAINAVMPLICVFAIQMSYIDCVGLSTYSEDLFRNPAIRIWPFGNAFSLLFNNSGQIFTYAVVMLIIFLAAAYFGYTKRHAENIGKSFVFRYSYVIASSLVAVTLVFMYTYALEMEPAKGNFGVVLPLAIILFILMLIMEVINYKKIMSIVKFLLRYVAILFGGIFACFLFSKTGGFGAESFIPTTSSIDSVDISYTVYSNARNYNSITVKSKDMIDLVRAEHKAVLEKAKQNETDYYDSDQRVYISYTLKTGENIYRDYSLPISADACSDGFWQTMFNSDDYKLENIDSIKNDDYLNQVNKATIQLRNYHSSKVYIEYKTNNIDELYKAIEKDLLADKNYGRHDEAPIGVLAVGYYEHEINEIQAYDVMTSYSGFHSVYNVTIYENYENTLALLKQHGTVPTPEEAIEDGAKNCEIFMLYRAPKSDINQPSAKIYNSGDAAAIFITAEEFKELSAHHVKYNLPAESENEYNYHVIRGLWSDLSSWSPLGFMIGLKEIGMDYNGQNEYDFLDDDQLYYKDNYYETDLHESMNEYCDALFEERYNYNP